MNCENKEKRMINRCVKCNKKIGLTGFVCRCGGQYCALHRNENTHLCSYDYVEESKKRLEENLIKIDSRKLQVSC